MIPYTHKNAIRVLCAYSYICSDKVIILQLILRQTNTTTSVQHIDQVKDENVSKRTTSLAYSRKQHHNHTQAISRLPYKKDRWAIFQHFSFSLVGVHISDQNKD